MPRRAACLTVGFAWAHAVFAADPQVNADQLSPVRQYLRETIKAKLPAKPADTPAIVEPKPADVPLVLPPFLVNESRDVHVFEKVAGVMAQKKRLSTPALFKSERVDILQPPILDDQPSPSGMPRLKLNIFQLKW